MIIGMRFNFKKFLKEIIKLFNYCTLSQIITNHKIPYTILLKHISSGDIKYIKLFGQKLINQKVINLFKKIFLKTIIFIISKLIILILK